MKKPIATMVLGLCAWQVQAACPTWPTEDRFSQYGAEVIDKRTGLVWARCSLGQSWNGSTCTGRASTHTHEEALAQAQAANVGGTSGWRLPNVKELASLVASLADKGCIDPAIDVTAFPNTPSRWYWTSSPTGVGYAYSSYSSYAWGVYFGNGEVQGNQYRGYDYAVRLVRASQ